MKHFETTGNLQAANANISKGLSLALLLWLLWLMPQHLRAQCTMLCNNPDPAMPMIVYLDANCGATLLAHALLNKPDDCPGPTTLTVRNGSGNVVAFGSDSLYFHASAYVNQPLSVTLQDEESGLFCVSFIAVVDNTAPQLTCEDRTISCVEVASPLIIEFPTVRDNCDTLVSLEYRDEQLGTDCGRSIRRTWTATDHSGNTTTCVQMITVARPVLDSILFPKDTTLHCDRAPVSPDSLGHPKLQGKTIDDAGSICSLYAAYTDSLTERCGTYGYAIQRLWRVMDECSGAMIEHTQRITVEDKTPPTITCLNAFRVNADPGQCHATVMLPQPQIRDNCDTLPQLFVSTSYGAVGLGPHPFVPVGMHTVQYTAVDACGNTRVCLTTLIVVDDQPPTVICENYTTIALPSVGVAAVAAKIFDKGSRDNCAPQVFFKVRKAVTGSCNGLNGDDSAEINGYQEWFDDNVYFCCDEVGNDSVQVILRVYEINPGNGPINPTRETPGGDLYGRYSECKVFVKIQDKLPPVINMPSDTIIDCKADHSNLSKFGSPVVKDNCEYRLDSTFVKNLNECGVGTIVRTFVATDKSNNQTVANQIIRVVAQNPLKADDIIWPANYTTNVCGAKTEPKHLPEGYDKPVIKAELCGLTAMNHTDQFFDVAQPACYRILRTWEVIDWCRYDPQHPEQGGRFAYIQTITVEDTEAPIISCPGDIVVSTSSSCGAVQVNLPPVTAQDCSTNVLISNDSPYATSNGANASGSYPPGLHTVTFTIRDRCGNQSTCKVKITVRDELPPNPICIVGLSANVSLVDGDRIASVDAQSFDGGSADNCTPRDKLKCFIRRAGSGLLTPPTTTRLTFSCDEVGLQPIEFWVTDEAGNSNYCVTYVAIQDNNRLCPQPTQGTVAGSIQTPMGDEVEQVMVKMNHNAMQMYTGQNGNFVFPNIPTGHDYTVVPERDNDVLNGVSTIDILLISKHILGVQRLDSPYKIIAADVDRSRTISALDMIRLRKLILGVDQKMPNGNRSWRFVDANFRFPNPENPFQTEFPEIYNINNFPGGTMHVNFVAIKVGDVNNSAKPNAAADTEMRASLEKLTITVQDQLLKTDEIVTVPLRVHNAAQLIGYQFAIHFDSDLLEFVNLDYGNLPDMNDHNFALHHIDEGVIMTSWNVLEPRHLPTDATLFQLTFRARETGLLSKAIKLSPRWLRSEAYKNEDETMDVDVQFANAVTITPTLTNDNFELYQNAPNPFATQTVVSFRLPETTIARLTIFDTSGRIVYTREGEFYEGYNEVIIMRGEVSGEGMLYYRLETKGRHATRKMLLLD